MCKHQDFVKKILMFFQQHQNKGVQVFLTTLFLLILYLFFKT